MIPPDFTSRLAAIGVEIEPGEAARLDAYLSHLLETNRKFNLTAVRDEAQAWERHILDSLTLVGPVEGAAAREVADVGSGGGLPGIPLAICLPEVRFTLIEATGKKAAFLRECIQRHGLANVEVVQERAETAGQDHRRFRERFDVVMARAVGPLRVLAELTVPLAKVGGFVFAVKGERAEGELAEARAALHALHAAHARTIATPTGRIVVLEKLRKTPRMYPRAPGEPKRRPL